MTSTYSNLKIQLMGTGDNATTWGNVTNVNLGTALEEAITGSADVTFASANVTLTLTDSNASQTARNMRLRCTGTTGGSTRDLIVPSIEKPYIVKNDCADSVQIKTSAGTGITVPAGKTMWVYNDATNVVDVVTYLSSVTFGGDLSVTGNSAVTGNATVGGTLAVTGNTTASNISASGALAVTGNTSTNNLAVTGAITATNINAGVTIVSGGTVSASTVGYRGLPQSVKTGSYTLVLADAGGNISTNSNVAIPANGTTAFPIGTTVVVYNDSASTISVTITTDTLRLAGTASTGTRSIAQRGLCTLLKVGTTAWAATGAGVS